MVKLFVLWFDLRLVDKSVGISLVLKTEERAQNHCSKVLPLRPVGVLGLLGGHHDSKRNPRIKCVFTRDWGVLNVLDLNGSASKSDTARTCLALFGIHINFSTSTKSIAISNFSILRLSCDRKTLKSWVQCDKDTEPTEPLHVVTNSIAHLVCTSENANGITTNLAPHM